LCYMLILVEHKKMEEIFTSLKLKLGSLLFHIINLMASSWPRYFVHLLTIHCKGSNKKNFQLNFTYLILVIASLVNCKFPSVNLYIVSLIEKNIKLFIIQRCSACPCRIPNMPLEPWVVILE